MMQKKTGRTRQQDPQAKESLDTSEEEKAETQAKLCPHVAKAVSLPQLKKCIRMVGHIGKCLLCSKEQKTVPDKEEEKVVLETAVWLCLKCGHQGCGRNSEKKHALMHYKTPHSDSHAVVVLTTMWNVWCYECDEEIFPGKSRKLDECVEYIKKQVSLGTRRPLDSCPQSAVSGSIKTISKADVSEKGQITKEENKQDCKDGGSKAMKNKKNVQNSLIASLPRVKGLSNLGNTCFFNSVMQSLSETHHLVELLSTHSKEGTILRLHGCNLDTGQCVDINKVADTETSLDKADDNKQLLDPLDIKLKEGGAVTTAVSAFLSDMHSGGRDGVVNPGHLFGQICKKSPQFCGFQQQDAHELLRHLLDSMRIEEIQRLKTGILHAFGLDLKSSRKNVEEKVLKQLKAYGKQALFTTIDKIFGGQLISSVRCEECAALSQVFETCMDLSLPVTEEKPLRPGLQKKASYEETSVEYSCKASSFQPHQSKKEIRQAKKANRRQCQTPNNKKRNITVEILGDSGQKKDEVDMDMKEGEESDKKIRKSKKGEEELGASDADIEDNLETSESRTSQSPMSRKHSEVDSESESKTNGDTVGQSGTQAENNCEKSGNTPEKSPGEENEESPMFIPLEKSEKSSAVSTARTDITAVNDKSSEVDVEGLSVKVQELQVGSQENTNTVQENQECERKQICVRQEEGNGVLVDKHRTCNVNMIDSSLAVNIDKSSQGTTTLISMGKHETSTKLPKLQTDWVSKGVGTLTPRYHCSSHECSVMSCLNQFTSAELLTGNNKFGCDNCTKLKIEKMKEKGECVDKVTKVYSNANKQLLISSPPAILTLHLKRFQQAGFSLRKVNRHVTFPFLLDLAPFSSSMCRGVSNMKSGQKKILYSLYAVVEHSGGLNGGHYTACVKVRPLNPKRLDFINHPLMMNEGNDRLMEEPAEKNEDGDDTGKNDILEETVEVPKGTWYHISDTHVVEVSEEKVLKSQAYLLFYERVL